MKLCAGRRRRRRGAAVGDVGSDGIVEEGGLLGDKGQLLPEPGEPEVPEVRPVEEDAAGGGVVEALQEGDHRRLAAPALPHQRHRLQRPGGPQGFRRSTGQPADQKEGDGRRTEEGED